MIKTNRVKKKPKMPWRAIFYCFLNSKNKTSAQIKKTNIKFIKKWKQKLILYGIIFTECTNLSVTPSLSDSNLKKMGLSGSCATMKKKTKKFF